MSLELLVVDDEALVQRIFSQRLRPQVKDGSVRLHFATTGQGALEILDGLGDSGRILVLTDINMPGMSGLELLRQIRARGRPASVYVVSAYENDEYRQAALVLGADGFFPKPLDFEELKTVLDRT